MTPKSEMQASRLDTVKLLSAGLILALGLTAFYLFSDYLLLVRVIGLLIAVAAAAGIALTTDLGSHLLAFAQEARAELRKVVWPSRNETLQTSLAVIAMVILTGLFLWLLDWLLSMIVRWLTS